MSETNNEKSSDKPTVVRNATDLQRLKLEKLMKNPDKPILLPEKPRERGMPVVPEFVRNVMGSSAGAGSGEFHVYRHLRRKEYARQKFMKERGERDRQEDEYHQRLEDNKRKADEKTAKRRAKRLKRKEKMKKKLKMPKEEQKSSESEEDSQSGSEREDDEKKIENKLECTDANEIKTEEDKNDSQIENIEVKEESSLPEKNQQTIIND